MVDPPFPAPWLVPSSLCGGECHTPFPGGPPPARGDLEAWPGAPLTAQAPLREADTSVKSRRWGCAAPNLPRQAVTEREQRMRWLRVCNLSSPRGLNEILPKLFLGGQCFSSVARGDMCFQKVPWSFCNLKVTTYT